MRHGNNVQSAALGFRPLVSIVLNKVPPQCQSLLSSICKSVDCWQACMRHSKTLETVHARNSYYSKELKQRTQYFQEVHFSTIFSKSTLKIFRFFPYGTFFCQFFFLLLFLTRKIQQGHSFLAQIAAGKRTTKFKIHILAKIQKLGSWVFVTRSQLLDWGTHPLDFLSLWLTNYFSISCKVEPLHQKGVQEDHSLIVSQSPKRSEEAGIHSRGRNFTPLS